MIELFYTSNIKLAALLDALEFDLKTVEPVTRYVRPDKSETVTWWFFASRKSDGCKAGSIFDSFVKGEITPKQIGLVDPIKFAASLLESRNKCLEIMHESKRFRTTEVDGKKIAISENASPETRQKFADVIQ